MELASATSWLCNSGQGGLASHGVLSLKGVLAGRRLKVGAVLACREEVLTGPGCLPVPQPAALRLLSYTQRGLGGERKRGHLLHLVGLGITSLNP